MRFQIRGQRFDQRFQDLAAFGLQLVGVQRKQHTAADADAAIHQGHAAGRQRTRQCLFQRFAPLRFFLALLDLFFQLGRQLQLHADHADQDQHEGAQQHRHQVAEDGPGGGGRLDAAVDVVAHAVSALAAARWTANCCRFSIICFCDIRLRSTTSRACAT
ncbi:hypothetical protein D3C73_1345380 [compost metagenome]